MMQVFIIKVVSYEICFAFSNIQVGIQINLCALMFQIQRAVKNNRGHKPNLLLNMVSTMFPLFLVAIAYVVDEDNNDSKNAVLNVARHAFSCTMRYM